LIKNLFNPKFYYYTKTFWKFIS